MMKKGVNIFHLNFEKDEMISWMIGITMTVELKLGVGLLEFYTPRL